MVNPYAVWNTARHNTASLEGSSDPLPSIYGALPFSSPSDTSSFLTFTFTGLNPTIANCTILGPNNSPQFRVVTDSAMPGYTILKTMDGKNSALIEWREPVKVEVRGMVSKQRASEFLRISSNKRYRIMVIRSQEFMWIPNGGAVSLYTTGSSDSEFLGRISRSVGAITLEMTQNAVRLGLLQIRYYYPTLYALYNSTCSIPSIIYGLVALMPPYTQQLLSIPPPLKAIH